MKLLSSFLAVGLFIFSAIGCSTVAVAQSASNFRITNATGLDSLKIGATPVVNNGKIFHLKATLDSLYNTQDNSNVFVQFYSDEGYFAETRLGQVVNVTFKKHGAHKVWAYIYYRKSNPIIVKGEKIQVDQGENTTTELSSISQVDISELILPLPNYATPLDTSTKNITGLPTYSPPSVSANNVNTCDGCSFKVIDEVVSLPASSSGISLCALNTNWDFNSFYLHEIRVNGKKVNAWWIGNSFSPMHNFSLTGSDHPSIYRIIVNNPGKGSNLWLYTQPTAQNVRVQFVFRSRRPIDIAALNKNDMGFSVTSELLRKNGTVWEFVNRDQISGAISLEAKDPCFLAGNANVINNCTKYNHAIFWIGAINSGTVNADEGVTFTIEIDNGLCNLPNTVGWLNANNATNPIKLISAHNLGITNNEDFNYNINLLASSPFGNLTTFNTTQNHQYQYRISQNTVTNKKVVELRFFNADIEAFAIQNGNIFNNNLGQCLGFCTILLPLAGNYPSNATYNTRVISVLSYLSNTGISSAPADTSNILTTRITTQYNPISIFPFIQLGCGSGKYNMHDDEAISTLSAYPNPFTETVRIDGLSANEHIEVYNLQGQMVKTADNDGANGMDIDLSAVPAGMYLVRVLNDAETTTFRLLKE